MNNISLSGSNNDLSLPTNVLSKDNKECVPHNSERKACIHSVVYFFMYFCVYLYVCMWRKKSEDIGYN